MNGQQHDPRQRARDLRAQLDGLKDALRADVEQFDEPQLRALLESSAEVIGGLGKTFGDYAAKNEAAWR
jgi:hypothetical protein